FGIDPVITGVIVTALVGFVIIGGTKRIVHVAQMTVPFMAVGYILVALVVIAVNFDRIPDAVGLIMRSAFGADEVFGGIVGYAIAWGIQSEEHTSELQSRE